MTFHFQATLAILIAASALNSACTKANGKATPNAAPTSSFQGGVNGGGGGTLPAEKVSRDEIINEVLNSRTAIEVALRHVESSLGMARDPKNRYAKLFAPDADIFGLLGQIKMDIKLNEPCHDFYGASKDASVDSSYKNGICVSIPELTSKLSRSNYQSEIPALVLHEISHLMGTTEDEAVEIQKDAVWIFREKTNYDIRDWARDVGEQALGMATTIDLVNTSLMGGQKLACETLQSLPTRFHTTTMNSVRMMLVRYSESRYYYEQHIKLAALADFLCSQPGFSGDSSAKAFADIYAGGFNGATRVAAGTYHNNTPAYITEGPWNEDSPYALWISKVSDLKAASVQLTEVSSAFKMLNLKVNQIATTPEFNSDYVKAAR